MDITYPDRYYKAVEFVEQTYGDLEKNDTLDNMHKLVMYALRQQVEVGPCKESAPYMWNVKERYKHNAWCQLKNMSKFEAMFHYVQHLDELVGTTWIQSVTPVASAAPEVSEAIPPPPVDPSSEGVDADLDVMEADNAVHVAWLIAEVKRLRTILRTNNIPFAVPSGLAEPPTEKQERLEGSLQNETGQGSSVLLTSSSSVSGTDQESHVNPEEALPPLRTLAPLDPNAVPPERPVEISGSKHNQSVSSADPNIAHPVRKLSWLEWLGILSVED